MYCPSEFRVSGTWRLCVAERKSRVQEQRGKGGAERWRGVRKWRKMRATRHTAVHTAQRPPFVLVRESASVRHHHGASTRDSVRRCAGAVVLSPRSSDARRDTPPAPDPGRLTRLASGGKYIRRVSHLPFSSPNTHNRSPSPLNLPSILPDRNFQQPCPSLLLPTVRCPVGPH